MVPRNCCHLRATQSSSPSFTCLLHTMCLHLQLAPWHKVFAWTWMSRYNALGWSEIVVVAYVLLGRFHLELHLLITRDFLMFHIRWRKSAKVPGLHVMITSSTIHWWWKSSTIYWWWKSSTINCWSKSSTIYCWSKSFNIHMWWKSTKRDHVPQEKLTYVTKTLWDCVWRVWEKSKLWERT